MTGSIALDVVIGLVFIYTLYSLLTTTIVELIATYCQLRARNLVKGIERMLDDDNHPLLSQKFYDTPLIKYMSKGSWFFSKRPFSSQKFQGNRFIKFIRNSSWFSLRKPSYIHARNFSKAVIYVLKNDESNSETTLGMIRKSVETLKLPKPVELLKGTTDDADKDILLKDTETGKLLIEFLNESDNKIEKFKELLENWFNDTMDRVGGWYKRYINMITFFVGLVIATLFNVDTFQVAASLSKDPKLREQYLVMAGNLVKDSALIATAYDTKLAEKLKADTLLAKRFAGNTKALNNFIADSVGKEVAKGQKILIDRMDSLEAYSQKTQDVLTAKRKNGKVYFYDSWLNFWGCLITAIALSLGSPFWFDLLSKMMKLRGSVAKPEEKKKK